MQTRRKTHWEPAAIAALHAVTGTDVTLHLPGHGVAGVLRLLHQSKLLDKFQAAKTVPAALQTVQSLPLASIFAKAKSGKGSVAAKAQKLRTVDVITDTWSKVTQHWIAGVNGNPIDLDSKPNDFEPWLIKEYAVINHRGTMIHVHAQKLCGNRKT